jgi:uncharacterized membrane protein YecN with MAPEG domain
MANKGLPPALGSPDPYLQTSALEGKTVLQSINVGERPPLSQAMMVVLMLTILYYILNLLRSKINNSESVRSQHASVSQSLILMLAFLVLVVRLRLRVDLEHSEPPAYITTIYTCVVVFAYVQSFAEDVLFCTDSKFFRILRQLVRIFSTMGVYICVVALFVTLVNQGKNV